MVIGVALVLVAAVVGGEYNATLVRVIDGDTPVIHVELGVGVWLHDQPVRLIGIDCPELPTPAGKRAKAFASEWLEANVPLTYVDRGRDKYGRLLGYIKGKTGTLNDELLRRGHARSLER